MIKIKREEFDQWFDQAFDEAALNTEFAPDPSHSWAKVKKKLARRARSRRQLKLVPYVAASFLLGAYIFGTPAVSEAFQPLIKAATTIKDGVIKVTFGTNKPAGVIPKTAPPPDIQDTDDHSSGDGQDVPGGETLQESFQTLEEAADKLAFPLPAINDVAESFELTLVDVFRNIDQEKANGFSVLYERKTDNYGLYRISVHVFPPNTVMSITSGDSPNITMETVYVNGYEAYLQVTKDGHASLEYFVEDLYVSIVGALTKDEILSVGENLQFK